MKRFAVFLLSAFLAFSAWAQEAPDVLVKRITEEVLHIIRTDKELQEGNTQRAIELVDQKVLPHFNFTHMTALAVGKDWRKASPEQQKKLTEEFKTLLVRTYSNALTGYKNQTIRYKPARMDAEGKDVRIPTEILQPGGQPVQLDYNMEKLENGWKVYDVVVGGISLVTNYRDQFGQEVRANGIDGLIKAISTKNKSLEASKK
ncbi:MAG: putative phospholipid-binding protein MlaC precursor [Betaproteobacteria bacterium ADurb.Bin341]|nr:MAG: putative phospholipid-binding protein MlaC precursor [Betaproteobacteria bacterium ADurb.Bin341]